MIYVLALGVWRKTFGLQRMHFHKGSELVFMWNSHPFESAPFDSGGFLNGVKCLCFALKDLYDTLLAIQAQHAEQTMCSVNLGTEAKKCYSCYPLQKVIVVSFRYKTTVVRKRSPVLDTIFSLFILLFFSNDIHLFWAFCSCVRFLQIFGWVLPFYIFRRKILSNAREASFANPEEMRLWVIAHMFGSYWTKRVCNHFFNNFTNHGLWKKRWSIQRFLFSCDDGSSHRKQIVTALWHSISRCVMTVYRWRCPIQFGGIVGNIQKLYRLAYLLVLLVCNWQKNNFLSACFSTESERLDLLMCLEQKLVSLQLIHC